MFINRIVLCATKSSVKSGVDNSRALINAFFIQYFRISCLRQCVFNLSVASLLVITSGTEAYTQEYVVKQESQQFSELFLKIDNNDVIKFVNLDSVIHKLSFSYKERTQSFTDIGPGGSQTVEFNQPGVYDIQCHLHPDMRLTVFVPYSYNSKNY